MSEIEVIDTVVMDGPGIDVIEDDIQMLDERLLRLLLKDKTTNSNIIWATADYENLGSGFEEFSEITPELITGAFSTVIQPKHRMHRMAEQEKKPRCSPRAGFAISKTIWLMSDGSVGLMYLI